MCSDLHIRIPYSLSFPHRSCRLLRGSHTSTLISRPRRTTAPFSERTLATGNWRRDARSPRRRFVQFHLILCQISEAFRTLTSVLHNVQNISVVNSFLTRITVGVSPVPVTTVTRGSSSTAMLSSRITVCIPVNEFINKRTVVGIDLKCCGARGRQPERSVGVKFIVYIIVAGINVVKRTVVAYCVDFP